MRPHGSESDVDSLMDPGWCESDRGMPRATHSDSHRQTVRTRSGWVGVWPAPVTQLQRVPSEAKTPRVRSEFRIIFNCFERERRISRIEMTDRADSVRPAQHL